MRRKLLLIVVIASSVNLFLAADAFAAHKKPKQSSAEQIKARVVQLGSGTQTNMRVKRRDGTKTTGYVAEIHDNDFVVADPNTANRTTILFSDVKQMKGKNSSTGRTVSYGGGDNASIAEFATLIGGIILVVALAIPK